MTDGDELYELSRRKALAGLGTIGAASAGAGLGTSAFFSDQETFDGNSLQAGTLDMKVAYEEHYSDWSPDEDGSDTSDTGDDVDVIMWDGAPNTTGTASDLPTVDGTQYTGLPANDAWLIAVDDPDQFMTNTEETVFPTGFDRQSIRDGRGYDPCASGDFADGSTSPPAAIELGDVKPGDFGEVTFSFGLCDNPGYVWLNAANVVGNENGLTEPEADDPDEQAGVVELLDAVRAAVWVDDGNNYQNGSESPFPDPDDSPARIGSLRTVLAALGIGDGLPLAGDISAPTGGGTGRSCFSASTVHDVVFAWWLPVDHANEIQSDSVTFDLGFYTEQCRHNDGLSEGPLTLTGATPQGQGAGFANPWDISTTLAHSGSGSWGTIDRSGQGISSYKQGFYFGGDFDNNNVLPEYTVGDIEDISYWLYEPSGLGGVDIYLNIYTEAEGDGNDAAWYDSRLQALPSEANNGSPNFNPGAWNEFTTAGSVGDTSTRTLVWSDTGRGGNFVTPLPTLDDVQAGAPLDWNAYGGNISFTHDYRDEEILALSLQVGSVSGIGLEAYIDDVTVTLESGETLNLDLEP